MFYERVNKVSFTFILSISPNIFYLCQQPGLISDTLGVLKYTTIAVIFPLIFVLSYSLRENYNLNNSDH
jgi:hypothetical protein